MSKDVQVRFLSPAQASTRGKGDLLSWLVRTVLAIANGLLTDFDRRHRTKASYLKDGKTETRE